MQGVKTVNCINQPDKKSMRMEIHPTLQENSNKQKYKHKPILHVQVCQIKPYLTGNLIPKL